MQRLHLLSIPFIGLAMTAAAQAQPPGGGFASLDTDGDGLVSQMEFAARETRRGPKIFERADSNGDGAVSLDELQGAIDERADERHARASERMQEMFGAMDENGDGLVTPEEANTHAFAQADSNGDGFISEDEAQAVHERRGGRFERRRERRSGDA